MAAKEDENSNNKSKEKEDKKEKGNKDEEVSWRTWIRISYISPFEMHKSMK